MSNLIKATPFMVQHTHIITEKNNIKNINFFFNRLNEQNQHLTSAADVVDITKNYHKISNNFIDFVEKHITNKQQSLSFSILSNEKSLFNVIYPPGQEHYLFFSVNLTQAIPFDTTDFKKQQATIIVRAYLLPIGVKLTADKRPTTNSLLPLVSKEAMGNIFSVYTDGVNYNATKIDQNWTRTNVLAQHNGTTFDGKTITWIDTNKSNNPLFKIKPKKVISSNFLPRLFIDPDGSPAFTLGASSVQQLLDNIRENSTKCLIEKCWLTTKTIIATISYQEATETSPLLFGYCFLHITFNNITYSLLMKK